MGFEFASCEEQYKKCPDLDRNQVLELQKWQKTQPHLPNITELEAIIFLHAYYNDIEKAKQIMDLYFTVRTHCPEFFAKRDVFAADFTGRMDVSGMSFPSGLTKGGNQVIFCKMMDPDPAKFIYVDHCKVFTMVIDYYLAKNGVRDGYAMVIDMEGSTFAHMTKVNIITMRKFLYYVQTALPIRLREFHFINAPSFMDKVMAMMRPFMVKELIEMMHIHTSLDTFLDAYVPTAIMPEEYGGKGGKTNDNIAKVYSEMQSSSEFFIEEEKTKRVNERLRPGKPKTDRDVFGYFVSLFSRNKSTD